MDLEKIKILMDSASHLVFALVIFATTVVKLTPTKADDKRLNSAFKKIHSLLSYAPTLGVNPMTRELKNKIKEPAE